MAVPDNFRVIFIALAAMVAYRFVSELSSPDSPPVGAPAPSVNKTAAAAAAEATHHSASVADTEEAGGHAVADEEPEEAAPAEVKAEGKRKKKAKAGSALAGGPHRLKKNEVLIEYCTS